MKSAWGLETDIQELSGEKEFLGHSKEFLEDQEVTICLLCVWWCTCGGQGAAGGSQFSRPLRVSPVEVFRLGGHCLYPPSHLAHPAHPSCTLLRVPSALSLDRDCLPGGRDAGTSG